MSDDITASIVDDAKRIVRGERRRTYGKPGESFERIAALWSEYLRLLNKARGHAVLMPEDVAAMMRLMKEARLIQALDHRDSYVDLVGYALCGAEIALKDADQS